MIAIVMMIAIVIVIVVVPGRAAQPGHSQCYNVGDGDVCTNQWMPVIMRRLLIVLVVVAVIPMIDYDHDDHGHDDHYVPT